MTQLTTSPDLQDIFAKGIREILPAAQWPDLFSAKGENGDFYQFFLKQADTVFGSETASGIFLRGGWAGFKFLVRQHGKSIGIDSLEFRLQPPRQRLMDGLNRITALLREWKTDEFITEQNGDNVVLMIRSSKGGLTAGQSRIGQHFYAGLFQEYLYWAGGGKQYPFEVKPLAEQAAVRIQFRLLPVD